MEVESAIKEKWKKKIGTERVESLIGGLNARQTGENIRSSIEAVNSDIKIGLTRDEIDSLVSDYEDFYMDVVTEIGGRAAQSLIKSRRPLPKNLSIPQLSGIIHEIDKEFMKYQKKKPSIRKLLELIAKKKSEKEIKDNMTEIISLLAEIDRPLLINVAYSKQRGSLFQAKKKSQETYDDAGVWNLALVLLREYFSEFSEDWE